MLTNKLRVQIDRVALPLGRILGNAGLTANGNIFYVSGTGGVGMFGATV